MQAVILAGGKGKRLAQFVSELPKPMVPLGDKPILEYQIELLKKYGITDIILCTSYLSEKIEEYFQDGKNFGVNISYAVEETLLGTGGAIKNASQLIKEDFILLFGDLVVSMNLEDFIEFSKKNNAFISIASHKTSHPWDSTLIEVDKENKITKIFGKIGKLDRYPSKITQTSVYFFKKEALKYFPEGKFDLDKDILPSLIEKENILAYITDEYAKDMGTPERYEKVKKDFELGKIFKNTAIFLDRDGVINEEINLLHKPEQLKLIKDSALGIKLLNENNFLTLVVTNQPVIARNLCDIKTLDKIHKKMNLLLNKEGAKINKIYYCPHHPDKGYPEENPKFKIDCNCRKPKIGMLKKAEKDFNLDLKNCYIIGDSTGDIQTGINAGCKTVLVKTGFAGKDNKHDVKPDFIAENLYEAAKIIIRKNDNI